uniref:NAD(P)-binding domain-containing protein n=1 Tax=viral metagenome TaxID=1070528 RepID=A0A6C0DTU7_9ZZZZ
MRMNILVTGGCGFIGSNFINYILKKDTTVKIFNIDCLNYCANVSNVNSHPNYKFIKGNITSKDLVLHILNEYSINAIIHFAAQSHVDNSFDNSLQYTTDNVMGTHVLLQASKEYGKIKKFLHFSTDEVYGEVDLEHPGCHEKSLLNPTNPYAATKAAAEFLVRSYYHSFNLPVVIVRCNNVYGPNQYPEKLIPKFIKLLREGKLLTIHGNGSTRRNFIWAEDVSSATELIFHNGVLNEVYNIGTKQEYSVMDVATLLIERMTEDRTINNHVIFVEDRPFNDFRYSVDTTLLKSLGWEEKYTNFIENIESLIETAT